MHADILRIYTCMNKQLAVDGVMFFFVLLFFFSPYGGARGTKSEPAKDAARTDGRNVRSAGLDFLAHATKTFLSVPWPPPTKTMAGLLEGQRRGKAEECRKAERRVGYDVCVAYVRKCLTCVVMLLASGLKKAQNANGLRF